MATTPQFPGWPRVYYQGRIIEVSPGWILVRMQEGLTPATCDILALTADRLGVTVETLHSWGLGMLLDSEVQP